MLRWLSALLSPALLALTLHPAVAKVFDAESYTLPNGLTVIVVENHRAPVVTQMVWYRVGAADEPAGKSGIAHFLEHLMFKGTATTAPGEFSKLISANGGNENAFTGRDYTGYWQTVAKDRLELVMRYESDRMRNLSFDEEDIVSEREVIIEERRSRVENNPGSQLDEAMMAALFRNHPYGIPIIGWLHEMQQLTLEDARDFYERWYGPDNAILILGGDITLEEARPLVEKYYAAIEPVGAPQQRVRRQEPPLDAVQSVTVSSPLVSEPQWSRAYLGPQRTELAPGDQEAMEILGEILGGGPTSRLYRALVIAQGIAVSAGSYDRAQALDYTTFHLYAQPRDAATLQAVEAAVDAVIQELKETGVTEAELRQAKDRLQASAIFARDAPTTGPRMIGGDLATGTTLEEIQSWPERVEAVTVEQVNNLLRKLLVQEHSVTGYLLPQEPA
jgi:zinc protease